MGRTDFGSRSPKHCVRFKNSISLCSVSKASSNYSGSSGISPNSRYRSSTPSGKGGCLPSAPNRGCLLQSFILSPQKRRGHATSDRPQLPQSVHRQHALSNGSPISHKISFENRSLHDQTRLERCLPFGTDSPGIPKISTVHLERQNLPVPSAPLRIEHSPSSVHAVAKTSGSLSTESWSSPCDLSRRHSHYIGSSVEETRQFTEMTMSLLESSGFIINKEKSIFTPTQIITFLGFTINSITMQLTLPQDKVRSVRSHCHQMLSRPKVSLRSIAQILGLLESYRPAIWRDPLHMRRLQATDTGTTKFPTKLRGGSESLASLETGAAMVDTEHRTLQWKPCHDPSTRSHDLHGCVKTGMGCSLRKSASEREMVSYRETSTHLELKGAFLAIQALLKNKRSMTVSLNMDNSSAVAYINHKGGTHSPQLLHLTLPLWEWCIQRDIFLVAHHVPGKSNSLADRESRVFLDNSDWMLDPNIIRPLLGQTPVYQTPVYFIVCRFPMNVCYLCKSATPCRF